MPKVVVHAIIWLEERGRYVRCEPGSSDFGLVPGAEEEWLDWLAGHASFAFEGKQGHLTLRKEARARQGEYWYAYRCQNRRTVKRYAGRTGDLTITRLEEIASEINLAFTAPQTRQARQTPDPEPGVQTSISPLLTSKLSLRRLHRALLTRARLLAQLDAGLEQPLTLLCAPAGFGKTTLVRQWLAASNELRAAFPAIAWISLDVGDNDPARFWHSIFTATRSWYTLPEQHLLSLLYPPSQPYVKQFSLEVVLTSFLNEVARQNISGLLILEDYHVIGENRIHETLDFLLAHLPDNLHVVLLTRHEPPLALARLRANGHLNELRTSDLRFSLAESAAFLQEFALSAQALEHLDTHLEGWAAGLRLLAISLQGKTTQAQLEHTLATFRGNHRPILDYFVSEVLHTQSAMVQDFLLRTSVLPRLTSALCAAVTEQQESASLLERIERANLFLEALDEAGEWYRYHALFAEAMQHEALRRLGEDELCAICRHASCWFEEQGMFSEAIEAALKARDSERAARLIELLFQSPQIQGTREYHTHRRWLESLPTQRLQQSPLLCFGYAITLMFDRKLEIPGQASSEQELYQQIETLLQRAEEGWLAIQDLPRIGTIYAFRATTAMRQGKMENAAHWARQALTLLSETDIMWRSSSLNALAFQALQKGQINEAWQLFQQVESLAQTKGNAALQGMATLFLGIISFMQGKLHQASGYYHKISQNLNQAETYPASLIATLPLTMVLYEWNDLGRLQQHAQMIFELSEHFSSIPQNFIHVAIEIPLACLQHAQGETQLAIERLENLWTNRRVSEHDFPFFIYQEGLYWLVRFSLLRRDQPGAQRWLNELIRCYQFHSSSPANLPRLPAPVLSLISSSSDLASNVLGGRRDTTLPPHLQEQKTLLLARFALLEGEAEQAIAMLSEILPDVQAACRAHYLLQIRLLMAQAYAACKQPAQARQWLQAALELGYPEGFQRSFLDEGEQLAPLLRELLLHLHTEPLRGYARTLLRAFPRVQQNPVDEVFSESDMLVDPLSPQEQRVLRLLAAGHSNAEIARQLVVSVNTVRTQIQSIYRKLQVNNRHAASEVARQLHLG
ncbi:MAG TPA: LuxR C-terminal-related transcriptional regulator [Ktedonobacteraceae bacterium]